MDRDSITKFKINTIAHDYFEAWNNQDVDALRNLFSENVKLVDWNVEVQGIDSVVGANANIWKDVPDIRATVYDIATSPLGRAYCHINIKGNNGEIDISVIDVLSINDEKIYRVDAYHNDS